MGKTIGIIAIKGGVGKTTTVSNLGAVLASEFNKKVLLVDANFSAPNLGLHLGIVDPAKTLHDVIENKATIHEAVQEHDHGFHIIPSSLVHKKINPFKLKNRLASIKKNYDVILVDSSPTLNEEILATMLASDELYVVTSADYPTLSCTMSAVKLAKERKTPISGLIINKTRGEKFELSLTEIEESTGIPVLAVIPDDIKVLEALSETKSAALHAPKKDFAIEYKKLAGFLVGEEYKDKRLKTKVKDFFLTNHDVPKQNINRILKE
ncbi:AAA family ATPase [Nanoarchaeota archaeon]